MTYSQFVFLTNYHDDQICQEVFVIRHRWSVNLRHPAILGNVGCQVSLDNALNTDKKIILFNIVEYRLILANWVSSTGSAVGKDEKELNAGEVAEWGLGKIIVLNIPSVAKQYQQNRKC